MTTYQETIDYLYARLPVFHRIGKAAFNPKLETTLNLCKHLGNPQEKFKSIHVAGTNGKGSTSHFLSSILQEAGYKVGLYTSPHLKDFNERFKINGKPLEHDKIISFVKENLQVIEEINPSFFELSVALAFDTFAKEEVDIAIIEVGLGGRLDSTNVINPILSVITNIGFDHTDILGETLPKIAIEKAGIIKQNTPVVVSERHPETELIFQDVAKSLNADIFFAQDHFLVKNIRSENLIFKFDLYKDQEYLILANQESGLLGQYQAKNIQGVVQAITCLNIIGYNINLESISLGIKNVIQNTNLKGRFQILNAEPLTICDTGHNEHGITEVLVHLQSLKHAQIHFILGFVKDKSIDKILQLLPKSENYVFCEANLPRALDANILAQKAFDLCGIEGKVIKNVNEAIEYSTSIAGENDMIFIGGSTFLVAEINNL